MTTEQAAQLIAQNDKLIAFYSDFLPLLKVVVHDIFPACAVGLSAWLGVVFGKAVA